MVARQPPYLLRLSVDNFRTLCDVELHLQPLNVLVGPNGAGKSNLLDVIAFLGDSVREDLVPAIMKRHGFDRVAFRGKRRGTRKITIEIEANVSAHSSKTATDKYTLEIDPLRMRRRGTNEILQDRRALRRKETFQFKRTPGQGRRITIDGQDMQIVTDDEPVQTGQLREESLGLSTLPRLGAREGGAQVDALATLFASFRVFDVNVRAVRTPTSDGDVSRLADDASNLASFLQHLKESTPDRFEALEQDARLFIPGLEGLDFALVGGATSTTVLQLRERGLTNPTDLADASFGSIRALALLAVLYDPEPPKLTCIEEIDHGLHPYVLDRLVELLRGASKRTQLLIATHSPAMVNRLYARELIVCERAPDATSRIPAVDPEVVRKMEAELNGDLGLGELWFSGALGGVPEL